MGSFSEHIAQAKSNLDFLEQVNNKITDKWDWQVTACFYVAVHLINAHIVSKTNKNYLSHNQVSDLISPYNQLSLAKLDEETYISYTKLQHLSRRSRYLLNENFKKTDPVDIQSACATYDKHFKKSIYHLDKLLTFTHKSSNEVFRKFDIQCPDMKGVKYNNFSVVVNVI